MMYSDFLEKLKKEYPQFIFKAGRKYAFRPPRTIMVGLEEPHFDLLFLHELSHALLGHKSFKVDVMRLKMENEAWEKARELARSYNVEIDEEMIQQELDTYRNWLHQKSRCPNCGLTRFETPDGVYHCPLCENN